MAMRLARLWFAMVFGLVGCCAVAAQAQPQGLHEPVIKDLLDAEDSLANALAKITDVTSARANARELSRALRGLATVIQRYQALPAPAAAEDKRLESVYGQRAKATQERTMKEIERVKALPGVAAALRTSAPELFTISLGMAMRARANQAMPRPSLRGGARPAEDQFAPDRMLKLTITGANEPAVGNAINDRIQAILRAQTKGGPASFRSSSVNGTMTVTVGPWDLPPEEFAAKIDFGKVARVQGREIALASTLKASELEAAQRKPASTGGSSKPGSGLGLMPGDKPGAASEAAEWKVTADPGPLKLEVAAGNDFSIRVPPAFWGDNVIFPTAPSPFVVVGGNGNNNEGREAWDLRTKKRAGALRGELKVSKPFAVSPDGQFFAAKGTFGKQLGVWSLKTGRGVRPLEMPTPFTEYLDFAGPNQIITGNMNDRLFQVWNFQTGAVVHEIRPPVAPDKDSPAVSPGRKYFAISSSQDGRLRVYDLTTGGLVGSTTIPKEGPFPPRCLGLTFSDDGTELAGVFETFPKLHVIVWDFPKGEIVTGHTFENNSGIKKVDHPLARALEWMPGNQAMLLFGTALVDRKTGKVVGTLPMDDRQGYPKAPRRLVDTQRALVLSGSKDNATLRIVPIPKDTSSARVQK